MMSPECLAKVIYMDLRNACHVNHGLRFFNVKKIDPLRQTPSRILFLSAYKFICLLLARLSPRLHTSVRLNPANSAKFSVEPHQREQSAGGLARGIFPSWLQTPGLDRQIGQYQTHGNRRRVQLFLQLPWNQTLKEHGYP